MTHKKVVIFALCFLVTTTSFAFGMRNTNDIGEVNCMLNPESCLHQAAWYQDRDNAMTPVSTKKGVGAAMAIIDSKNGYSQSVQVCPGIYLATAHGALDNPTDARSEGRAVRGPNNNMQYIDPYPMSDDEYMKIENATFTSPRLRDPSKWTDPSTDYVFIKVDNPIRPKNIVRPVTAANEELLRANSHNKSNVYLHRPDSLFALSENSEPNFSQGLRAQKFEEVSPLYATPNRVNQSCRLSEGYSGVIGTDCPTEVGVSGSPYVSNMSGQDYLVGLHVEGSAASEKSFENTILPNAFIPSAGFCNDYESVCGQPCVDLNEVLPEQVDGISI